MNDLIYGKRQQGKSTLAAALAASRNRRVAIWDPNDQYPIFRRADSASDLSDWLARSSDAEGYTFIRYGPFESDEIEERFAEFAEVVFGTPNLSVIVDEAHMLQGSNWIDPNLDRLNRRSPSGFVLIQTTHRIVNANPDSRYHANNTFFFLADLPKELKTIEDNFGSDVARIVPNLAPYQVVRVYRQTGGVRRVELWPDGKEWFIDLENRNHD